MDNKFFTPSRKISLKEIIELTNAETNGDIDLQYLISDVAPLERALPDEVTFIKSRKSLDLLEKTQAHAAFCVRGLVSKFPDHIVPLIVTDPQLAFVQTTKALYPQTVDRETSSGLTQHISDKAIVDPSAKLEEGVTIDSGVVIGADVEIGSGTKIGPNTVIGKGCKIGRNCFIGPNATIEFSLIGNNVSIFSGVSLGQDGFGYVSTKTEHIKVPQIGRLIIQNDVEIGANTTIDRGALDDTVIGEGTKIDNLVQIGHNVHIGRHCIIVSQVGIAGSAILGDFVVLGGDVGVNGHIKIGDRAQIAAKSAVPSDVPEGARWGGIPARPMKAFLRDVAEINARAFGRGKHKDSGEQSE